MQYKSNIIAIFKGETLPIHSPIDCIKILLIILDTHEMVCYANEWIWAIMYPIVAHIIDCTVVIITHIYIKCLVVILSNIYFLLVAFFVSHAMKWIYMHCGPVNAYTYNCLYRFVRVFMNVGIWFGFILKSRIWIYVPFYFIQVGYPHDWLDLSFT